MKKIIIHNFLLAIIFYGCGTSIDKSRISEVERLDSPDGKFSLYRYFIANDMAFGSAGEMALNIVSSEDENDYISTDYFTLLNDTPFWIKWKNQDTLIVKCIIDGGGPVSRNQPIRKEVKKWKDWTFEVEYYSMYSALGESQYLFDNYSVGTNLITFKSQKDTLVFKNSEVQFSLDSNHVYVKEFVIDTFEKQSGLSFRHYDIVLNGGYNKVDFTKQQAFVRTKP